MPQTLFPSAHLLEIFMPYRKDGARMLKVLERATADGFYRSVELPTFADASHRRAVRSLLQSRDLTCTTYAAPFLNERGMSLCDRDPERLRETKEYLKYQASLAADSGYTAFGVPSGPDPGDTLRPEAMRIQADTLCEMADFAAQLGMNLTMEPVDRYAHKKALIGPMPEVCEWFSPIHAAHPNAFLHYDSAHETLGGADLLSSLALAAPFLSQMHLCDCITDRGHPCFGDLHMDVAAAPDWTTEGYLTPEIGADLLRAAAALDTPRGVKRFFVSAEILGHPGDDLWRKERLAREFLLRCFALAGLEPGK